MSSISLEDVAWILLLTDLLDDEEDLILVLLGMVQENLEYVPEHRRYKRFDINKYTARQCKKYFRFAQTDLRELHTALGLDPHYTCYQGSKFSSFEGLCLLLRRLSYPNRLIDLVPVFGRSENELSMMVNKMVNVIFDLHNHRLQCVNQPWADYEKFAQHVTDKGSPLDNIWGFIDGTMCYICRPSEGQQQAYNGHKRRHALKFQSLMCPNGIMIHFHGPMEGRRHDSALYNASGLDALIANITGHNGRQMAIYGDSAYAIRPHILRPFINARKSVAQLKFNTAMSKVRISVENGFAKVNNVFAFIDYSKNLKVFLQPVAKYYLVGVLFTNAHTCVYGSQVSEYFQCKPPSLREYFY